MIHKEYLFSDDRVDNSGYYDPYEDLWKRNVELNDKIGEVSQHGRKQLIAGAMVVGLFAVNNPIAGVIMASFVFREGWLRRKFLREAKDALHKLFEIQERAITAINQETMYERTKGMPCTGGCYLKEII